MKKNKIAKVLPFLLVALAGGAMAYAAATAVNLGTADSFAILAGSGITNTGTTVVTGDIGTFPTLTITGTSTLTINGTNHGGDAVTQQAKTDLTTAYNTAAGEAPTTMVSADLGGQNLTPGVYKDNGAPDSLAITGTLTLDAQGDPNAIFVFQSASTLATAANSVVKLVNGAQACNVFWQVGSSATLGTNSTFKGTILALTSATLTTGANVEGQVLAQNGAVTLDSNTVTKATCTVPPVVSIGLSGITNVPLISITKVPNPLALPSGPGSVVYAYAVSNGGTAPMNNVTVTDNKCAPVNYISGDTNGNTLLDQTEVWNYRCTTTVTRTTMNTATATGYANGLTAIDTANATVVVSTPLPPPLIHVVKKPDQFVLPPAGGSVIYAYTVTNPGVVALSNVSLADNKCKSISGPSGDANNNGLLDTNETWAYTCAMNIATSTTNTATAEGTANGLTAIDYAVATVVVNPTAIIPQLPNTGTGPGKGDNLPWEIIISAGATASLLLFSLVLGKAKKNK